ncbi:MAG: hypothetical protein ABSH46_19230 [Bryobacteraceae bacterium]
MTMKHDTSSTLSCSWREVRAQTLWLLGMALTTAGGLLLLALLKLRGYHPGLPLRILAVALPLVCGVGYIFRLLRDLARLDELQLRIQLEAAATACLGVFLVTILYPILQFAGFVGPLQPFYVTFLLVGLLMLGYFNANRRYR